MTLTLYIQGLPLKSINLPLAVVEIRTPSLAWHAGLKIKTESRELGGRLDTDLEKQFSAMLSLGVCYMDNLI